MSDFNGKTVDIQYQKYKKTAGKIVPVVIGVFVVLVLLLNSVYILQDYEDGVVLRFGRVNQVVTEAGLQFKIPFIEVVRKVNVERLYNMEYGYRTIQGGNEYSEPVYSD